VASDGGVFSYGDASFYGSTGAIHLDQPIVGMAPTPDGKGYWLVASDGGIFNFGDAAFDGSAAGGPALDPAERVVASPSGQGYWVEDQNGTAYPFGDAEGSPPTEALMFAPVTAGDRAVLFAFAQLGKPYIWGGNGPVGYDCSGLALASWENADGIGFARVSDNQYETAGQPVALSSLSAGDLVFWGTSQTDWTSVYHTAIYVGGDQIVEATGDQVQLNALGQWGSGDLMPNGRRP
jgi:cell wall-associated NlpC family hydrolase